MTATVVRRRDAEQDLTEHARVVACDRRAGRRFVLDRSRLRDGRGSSVGPAVSVGRRVAWTRGRFAGGRMRVGVRIARVDGRVRPVRAFTERWKRAGAFDGEDLRVALSRRGHVAWTNGFEAFAWRLRSRPRVISRGEFYGVAFEDDRTVRFQELEELRYFDLEPMPGNGCPRRERFRVVLATPALEVTKASYGPLEDGSGAVRACWRGSGRDPVVVSSPPTFEPVSDWEVVGVDGRWVVLLATGGGRGFSTAHVTVHEAGSGRAGLPVFFDTYNGPAPVPSLGSPLAVSAFGLPAWVAETETSARLVSRSPLSPELDSGPPGSIGDLAFRGRTLTWTKQGEPRSASVPSGS